MVGEMVLPLSAKCESQKAIYSTYYLLRPLCTLNKIGGINQLGIYNSGRKTTNSPGTTRICIKWQHMFLEQQIVRELCTVVRKLFVDNGRRMETPKYKVDCYTCSQH